MNNKQVDDEIKNKIFNLRNKQVILDSDIADFFNIETKGLNQAVKRNKERFPSAYMFQLTEKEFNGLRSQFVTANPNLSKKRFLPYVFTEQGVAMLSTVLKSKEAIKTSIIIINAFVSMRHFLIQNANIFQRFQQIDQKFIEHDSNFNKIFNAIEDKTITKKQGIFYDGQVYDAYKFVSDLIKSAKNEIILIDNYIDESVLILLSNKNKDVSIIIYTKSISEQLKLAEAKFNQQYQNLKIKQFNKSHDRFLIIDKEIYHFGASLKDLGKKWFGFSKFDKDALDILNKLN